MKGIRKWIRTAVTIRGVLILTPWAGTSWAQDLEELNKKMKQMELSLQEQQKELDMLKAEVQKQEKLVEQVAPKEGLMNKDQEGVKHLEVGGNKLSFYGFLRLDTIISDSRLNHNQYSMWARREDESFGDEENDEFIDIYPRL